MNSPALTNAVPATPVVMIGTRMRAEVVRDVATIVHFPSDCGGARVLGLSAKTEERDLANISELSSRCERPAFDCTAEVQNMNGE
jgi:hypothetical protein